MAKQNAYQVAEWNGRSGERWVANQARLDAMVAVFGQAAIEAVAPGLASAYWMSAAARAHRVWL